MDSSFAYEPPLQWIKAAVLNRLLGCRISRTCVVCENVRVVHWRNLEIGDQSLLSRDVRIDAQQKVTIGKHTTVGPGVLIATGDHSRQDLSPIGQPVVIGDGVFVGARAVILGGVTIGSHALIGAGAVVTTDIPECAVCAGVPGRVIGQRPEPDRIWTVVGYHEVQCG
jgi:maltose O-acetyltransferase